MGGIHTVYRKTTASTYKAATSTLILPTEKLCRENTPITSGYNGCFPEFFHGFYIGSYGLDAGVIWKGGSWKLFLGALTNTYAAAWAESSSFTAPADRQVVLTTTLSGGSMVITIKDLSGYTLATLSKTLITAAYNALVAGSVFNRELCLAMNKDSAGNYIVPADCYFKAATFKNTTLTTAAGGSVNLTGSNSNETNFGKIDPGLTASQIAPYYDKQITTVTSGGFINDTALATFDKTKFPL